jgi:opacity protein-like surface antigen
MNTRWHHAIAALAFGCGAGTSAAQAQSGDGWYVAASATGSDLDKPKQTIANAPTPGLTLDVVNAVDFGWGGQVEVGYVYRFLRMEAEIGRTENDSDSYSAVSPIAITLRQKGENNVTRYMANLYLEVPRGRWPVSPYVGGGIGAARAHVTTFGSIAIAPNAPPAQLIDSKETRFAYQFMGGLALPLGNRVALTAQYRWFDAGTVHGVDAREEKITRTIHGSNYDLGIRFLF